jgi:hypothetical protein
VAFRWKDCFWLIVDEWRGLAVYRSQDAEDWTRQPGDNLLMVPGDGPDDGARGSHADVVVNQQRAYLFYFTHPGRTPTAPASQWELRRSSIHVTALECHAGWLTCDRDAEVRINLQPDDR